MEKVNIVKDDSSNLNQNKESKSIGEFLDHLNGQIIVLKELLDKILDSGLSYENAISTIDKIIELSEALHLDSRAFYEEQKLTKNNEIDSAIHLAILHNMVGTIGGISNLLQLTKIDLEDSNYDDYSHNMNILRIGINSIESASKNIRNLESSELKIEEVNIKDILHISVENLRGNILEKQIKVNLNINGKEIVMADQKQLEYIIYDIINNAIKFTNENGNIDINTKSVNDTTEIIFKDDGIGISKELHNILLKERVNSGVGTNGEKGSGTGLQIASIIMNKMNGNIKIESEGEGKGTTVTITIPNTK